MEKERMDRISELTRISRERELSQEEKNERLELRKEYLAQWRKSTEATLENTYIVDEDGTKRKLKRK